MADSALRESEDITFLWLSSSLVILTVDSMTCSLVETEAAGGWTPPAVVLLFTATNPSSLSDLKPSLNISVELWCIQVCTRNLRLISSSVLSFFPFANWFYWIGPWLGLGHSNWFTFSEKYDRLLQVLKPSSLSFSLSIYFSFSLSIYLSMSVFLVPICIYSCLFPSLSISVILFPFLDVSFHMIIKSWTLASLGNPLALTINRFLEYMCSSSETIFYLFEEAVDRLLS